MPQRQRTNGTKRKESRDIYVDELLDKELNRKWAHSRSSKTVMMMRAMMAVDWDKWKLGNYYLRNELNMHKR